MVPAAPVHVVCRCGVQSTQVTAFLVSAEPVAVNVDGGMPSWVVPARPMVSQPMVSETGAPPEVA